MTDLSHLVAPGADAMYAIASEALVQQAIPEDLCDAFYAAVVAGVAELYDLDDQGKNELHQFVSAGIAAIHAVFERLAAHQAAVASATVERAGAAVQ